MSDNTHLQQRIQDLEQQIQSLQNQNEQLRQESTSKKLAGSKGAKQAGRLFGMAFLGRRFRKSLLKLYSEIPNRDVQRETLADVTAHALWRFTRIGIFAILVAAIPAAMVIMQTVLMNRQNRMMKTQFSQQMEIANQQNSLMQAQNELLSRELNDAQASEKEDRIERLLTDLKRDIRSEGGRNRNASLSPGLKNDIALFTDLESVWDEVDYGNELIAIVSNAKGELLSALLVQDLAEGSYDEVYANADFSQAGLQQATLDEAYLQRVPLENAFLIATTFREANLKFANLKSAILDGAIFSNASMNRANLNNAQARDAVFIKANLRSADLSRADLSGADLREVIISEANMDNTRLDGAKVDSPNWLDQLQSENVAGLQTILPVYRVNPNAQKDEYDREYYEIVRR